MAAVAEEKIPNQPSVIESILVNDIFADAHFNSRGRISPSDVVDLSRNIDKQGLLQPITIQPYDKVPGKRYRVVIGHRRFEAVKLLKWTHIDAIIKTGLNEADALALNLIENINRKDLNILQEAKALEKLKNAGAGIDLASRMLGKSKGWIQVRFKLLELEPEIQQEAAAGMLTQEQVRDIASFPMKDMRFQAVKNIKEAKDRGEKRAMKVKKSKKNPLKLKKRSPAEITEMIELILDEIGGCVATRVLAWCNGDISTLDLYRDLEKYALERGKKFRVPKEALASTG